MLSSFFLLLSCFGTEVAAAVPILDPMSCVSPSLERTLERIMHLTTVHTPT